MQLPPGLGLAVIASGLVAVCAVALLFTAAQRRGRGQVAHYLLAAGAGIAAVTTITALAGAMALADRWTRQPPSRTSLVDLLSIGVALAGLLFCAGLLRLPRVAATKAAALRLLLDGLVIASALWFVGFVLLSEPTAILGDGPLLLCPAVLLAAGMATVAIGLASAVALRSLRLRRGLFLVITGISVATLAGLGLAAGFCLANLGAVLTSAAVLPVALLLVAFGSRATDEPGQDSDLVRRRTAYAFLPMFALALAGIYHVLAGGRFMLLGISGWIVAGFALVARQYLALLDVRGIAGRLSEREKHFRQLAHTDPLTGLANRRGLVRAMEEAGTGAGCVLLCLDLDGFKNVNDLRGHGAGDTVLREVGARLTANLRAGDLAARLGGDKFAVLIQTGMYEARQLAERLLGALNRPYPYPAGSMFLSVSIGLAGCGSADSAEELLRNADLALRFAKQRGKNRVEPYDIAYDQWVRRRITLEHDLREAARRGELSLAFQPVVAVPSVRPVGAEALLRWRHPTLGSIRPDEFIPLAEERGMIADLGGWVLQQACEQLARWLAAGHDVWMSVNVSPRELHAPEYVAQVAAALRTHQVPPQRLVLEVTEQSVATDLDELIRRLRELRTIGVRIALDDFGAGYSSLGQLRKLPIDILKIDQSLVADREPARPAGNDLSAVAPMVDVVVRIGHRLGLEVIAEGVTSQPELAAVVEAGCRFGQGQLFGWGVPAEHLEAMLQAATSSGPRILTDEMAEPRQVMLRQRGQGCPQ
ncbi:MAG TPA: bifunctional diguanylate cyclase/phosphodiesterase [Micromonosporaceae bacterium]|nr:bifunctional diguanylate cyclase/phosphodiesterase [Micromonosporaceae bacterium]